MVNDWADFKLSEVINLIGGGTPKRSIAEYWGGDIPWLSVKDFNNEYRHVEKSDETITKLGLEKSSTKLLERGQIIISARGTVGELAQVSKTMAFNQSCYGIDAKTEYTLNDFLYYLLKHSISNIQRITHGAVFDTITRDTFNFIEVSLPPLTEQKAIAHILGSLDDKIELNRQMNETLEAMAQALFKSWFVDFDPVIDNALAAGNAIPDEFAGRAEQRKSIEKKDNLDIQSLFPDEFEFAEEMGWIPKGWRMSPLTEVIDFLEGPGIRNWQYTEEEDGIKFINIRCIQDGDIKLATANKITKEEAFGKYEHFQLEVDDIVVSASGTLGRYAFVRKEHLPLSLNTSVIRFRPIEGISTLYYIAGYIDTKLQFELETRATGSAQRNFGPMHLKQISMLLPPINILEKHLELAKRLFSKRKSSLEQVETLTKLRDTLLPKLMSGELRIPDATALVENV